MKIIDKIKAVIESVWFNGIGLGISMYNLVSSPQFLFFNAFCATYFLGMIIIIYRYDRKVRENGRKQTE